MKREQAIVLAGAAALVVAGLLVWGFIAGRGEAVSEAESEQTVKPAVQVSQNNFGPPTLHLSPDLQREAHIELQQPQTAPYQQDVQAYGSVLELQSLTDVANTLASANAQRAVAEAKLAASRSAFQRAQALYADNQNFSRAQLQAAESTFQSDQATMRATQVQAQNAAASAEQAWGPVLAHSLATNSALAQALIDHRKVLIQVTLPLGIVLPPSQGTASIEAPAGKRVAISFVSPAIRTDPKIQGASYFYTADAASGVLPGMNVIVFLAAGRPVPGIAVPAPAVVWAQGRAWVYLRTGENAFTRREISTAQPQSGGGYVVPSATDTQQTASTPPSPGGSAAAQGLPAHVPLVIRGAQTLLSQEFSAQIDIGT